MSAHCSERKKAKAEMWKSGCTLYSLQQIDLSHFEQGNIIVKKSQQKRVLANGEERIYSYHYENIDVFGKGQFHLPVKGKKRRDSNDPVWEIRDRIEYRKDIELRIKNATQQLDNAIAVVNSFKKSTEKLTTVESVMESVRKSMENKDSYVQIKRETEQNRRKSGYISFYEPNGLIVTDLGEEVRSKNECLFANKLKEMGIPYLYEMNVGGGVVPDFTIFLEDGVRFVELLGMMNDEKYREDQKVKIVKYEQMGIHLGSQLVLIDTTMGISMPEIERILLDIMENGAQQGIVTGYNRKKYDYIEARRMAFCEEKGGDSCEDNGDCF